VRVLAVRAWLTDEAAKDKLEIAFVWNRTASKISDDGLVPPELICHDLGVVLSLSLSLFSRHRVMALRCLRLSVSHTHTHTTALRCR
jgi:hypothetical protein